MSQPAVTPTARYAALVATLGDDPAVTYATDDGGRRRSFGANALKTHGKIFAMLTSDRLVVKLPRARVDALVAAGVGERFDPRHDGRLMKEWLVIAPIAEEQWLPLAQAALEFVGTQE